MCDGACIGLSCVRACMHAHARITQPSPYEQGSTTELYFPPEPRLSPLALSGDFLWTGA